MEAENPWDWRSSRSHHHSIPWKDTLKYRANVQLMIKMLRNIYTNRSSNSRYVAYLDRYCADCGILHNPVGPMLREDPPPNSVGFANPMLGTIICHECAKHHKELLSPTIGKVLYLFYDLHELSLDDIAQIARWGNLRAQRYWLGNYDNKVKNCQSIVVPAKSLMSLREWILRKYVLREWAIETAATSPSRLLSYVVHEQRVFAHLQRLKWVAPIGHSTNTNWQVLNLTSQDRKPKILNYKSAQGRSAKIESLPSTNKPRVIGVPVSKNLFASRTFPSLPRNSTGERVVIPLSLYPRNVESLSSEPRKPSCRPQVSLMSLKRINDTVDSDRSDNLYISGRPSLINSHQKVKEWQLSYQGNPEVTVFFDNNFQPDKIPKAEDTLISSYRSTEFFGNENQKKMLALNKTKSESSSFDTVHLSNVKKNSSVFDDLAVLVTTDQTSEKLVAHESDRTAICNDTIIEGSSTLMKLDAFVKQESDSAGVEYRCLSDDGTEIGSEYDKIEYECQPIRPLSKGEIETQSNKTEDEDRDELGIFVKDRQSASRSRDKYRDWDSTEMVNPPHQGHSTEYGLKHEQFKADYMKDDHNEENITMEAGTHVTNKNFVVQDGVGTVLDRQLEKVIIDESTAVNRGSACPSASSIEAISQPECFSSGISTSESITGSQLDGNTAQTSSKSSPFSNIRFDMRRKAESKENTLTNKENQDAGLSEKEGLLDFLMRTGLFSTL